MIEFFRGLPAAQMDEPIFTLRASDPAAAAAIIAWADHYRTIADQHGSEQDHATTKIVAGMAITFAGEMLLYHRKRRCPQLMAITVDQVTDATHRIMKDIDPSTNASTTNTNTNTNTNETTGGI